MTTEPEIVENALMANPALSRRAFFGLTAVVGSLHFMGSIFDRNALITAYADDGGNPHFVVVILTNEEIGAFVFDVNNKSTPIKDAHVKVTSRSNGKTVEGYTSEEGILVFNVKALAQNSDAENPVCYIFGAKAEVVAQGYREFAFDYQQIYSGAKTDGKAHIFFPAQRYDAATGGPYLRMACIDGHDALYTECQMPKYQNNTGVHDAKFQVVCTKGSTATCTLYIEGDKVVGGPVSAQSTEAGYATIEMSGTWVKDVQVLTKFYVVFEADGYKRSCPLEFLLREADFDITSPYIDNDFYLGVGAGGGGRKLPDGTYDCYLQNSINADSTENKRVPYGPTKITIPTIPWGSGLELLSSLPFGRVSFTTSPAGGIGLVIRSETWAPFADPDSPQPDPKGNFVQRWWKGFKDGWKDWGGKLVETGKQSLQDFRDLKNTMDPMLGVNAKGFANCDITANFEFKILAYVGDVTDEQKKEREEIIKRGGDPGLRDYRWDGTVRGGVNFLINGELGAQFVFAFIPVVVGLDFWLEISAAVEAGLSCKPAFRDAQWFAITEGSRGQGGFTVDITGEAGISAGVGVRGLLCVSARGYASFPVQFAFVKSNRGSCPHIVAKMNLGIQLVLQVIFFRARHDICKPVRKTLYDSWKKKNDPIAELESSDYDPDFYVDPALGDSLGQDVDSEVTYLSDDIMMQDCELSASLNDEGVLYDFDVAGLALPDVEQMQDQGVIDPYASNEGAPSYNPRRGLIPKIQTPFVNADGKVANTYSDPRMSIVQVGDYLYYCRIARVAIKATGSQVSVAVVPLEGRPGSDDSVDATGSDSYFIYSDAAAQHPHIAYTQGNGDDDGKLTLPTYGQVRLYADESQDSLADVAVAEPEIPLYSILNESGRSEFPDDDASRLGARTASLAIALGWDGHAASEDDPEEIRDALALAASESELRSHISPQTTNSTLTRVVVSAFNLKTRQWEKNDVVDFTLPSSVAPTMRSNANDVDFTAVADGDDILFGIITCTKPWTRRPDIQELKEGLYTNVVRYSPAKNDAHGKVIAAHSNVFTKIRSDRYEWKAVPYTITRKGGAGATQKYLGLTVTGPRGSYAGKMQNAVISYFYPYAARSSRDILAPNEDNAFVYYPSPANAINDQGVLQAFAQQRSGKTDALEVSWEYAEAYVEGKSGPVQAEKQRAVLWTFDTDNEGSKINQLDVTQAENYAVLGKDKGIAWLKRGVKKDSEVKLMNVRIGEDGLPLEVSDLGYLQTNAFFSSGNADYLYCVRVKEGSASAPNEDEAQAILDSLDEGGEIFTDISGFSAEGTDIETLARGGDTKVKQYQMTACRWDPKYKRYREFFPYAQLKSAPDTISAYPIPMVGDKLGGTSVLYSTITKLYRSNATTTYAEIPPVKYADIVIARCIDNFIAAGGTVHPVVRLINMGNLPVCGFTVEYIEKDTGNVIGTHTVDHLEKVVTSPVRPLREKELKEILEVTDEELEELEEESQLGNSLITLPDGKGYSNEDESILWPGNYRLYKTELKVPASWTSGAHSVIVRCTDVAVPSFNADDAECLLFENEATYLTIDHSTESEMEIDMDGSFETSEEDYEPVEYTELGNGNSGNKGDSGNGDSANTGDSDNGYSAKTGDDAKWAIAAAAAAAAAAAGAVAHKLASEEDESEENGA